MMKNKYLLLSLLIAATGSLLAQSTAVIQSSDLSELNTKVMKDNSRYHDDDPLFNQSLVNELWYSDFSNEAQWVIDNGQANLGWTITSTVTVWGFGSFNSESGGKFAQMDNGDATAGGTVASEHTIQNDTVINVASVTGGAIIAFQQYTARFYDEYYIEVSNDNTNWVTVGSNDHVWRRTSDNSTPPTTNGEHNAYYIPSDLVGTGVNDLWIRFRWFDDNSGIAYGWMIDDVSVYEAPANDLSIEEANNFGVTDTNAYWKYSQIPLSQAENSDFRPAAIVYSNGDVTQTDAQLDVVGAAAGYNSSSSAFSIDSETFAVVETADDIVLDSKGNYVFNYTISSGNADALESNNSQTWPFEVTDNIYAYDDDERQNALMPGDAGYTACMYYDNFNGTDTVVGIDAHFPLAAFAAGDYGLAYGQTIGASIYTTATDGSGNLTTEIYSNGFFTVDNGTAGQAVDGWVTVPMDYRLDTLSAFFACVRTYDDLVPISCDYGVAGFGIFNPDNGSDWFNFIDPVGPDTFSFSPFIRVRTKSSELCASTNIIIDGTVTDQISPCDVGNCNGEIDVTLLTGGTAPYTIDWSGPGGFTGNTQTVTITAPGIYSMNVSDKNGCVGFKEFTAGGNLGVGTLNEVEFAVYPNPATDVVNATFANEGSYNVEFLTIKGDLAMSQLITSGSNETKNIDVTSLSAGIYLMKVSGDNGSTTQEVVIK